MPSDRYVTTADDPGVRSPERALRLLIRPSGWHRIKLFGAPPRAQHVRRGADAIALAGQVVALVVLVPSTRSLSSFESGMVDTIATLPEFLRPLASIA